MYTYKTGSWLTDTLPTSFTSVTGDLTTWVYHAASGLLTSKKDAANYSVSYAYHSGTPLVSKRTWARGLYTDYTYDWAGRVATETHSDNTPDVTYAYDRLGRLDVLHDDAGQHTFAESFSTGNVTATETIAASTGGNRTSVLSGITLTEVTDKWGRRTNFDADKGASKLADFGYSFQSLTSRLEDVSATFPVAGVHAATHNYVPNSDLISTVQRSENGI